MKNNILKMVFCTGFIFSATGCLPPPASSTSEVILGKNRPARYQIGKDGIIRATIAGEGARVEQAIFEPAKKLSLNEVTANPGVWAGELNYGVASFFSEVKSAETAKSYCITVATGLQASVAEGQENAIANCITLDDACRQSGGTIKPESPGLCSCPTSSVNFEETRLKAMLIASFRSNKNFGPPACSKS